jgi:hypothetical protein
MRRARPAERQPLPGSSPAKEEQIARSRRWALVTARDLMREDVVTLPGSAPLSEVAGADEASPVVGEGEHTRDAGDAVADRGRRVRRRRGGVAATADSPGVNGQHERHEPTSSASAAIPLARNVRAADPAVPS